MHTKQNRKKYKSTKSKQNNMQIADTIATRKHNMPWGDGGDDDDDGDDDGDGGGDDDQLGDSGN